jgi:predicted Rossmann fold nucleotide-binding protein DprA/Smf involved in DNA uptake
MTCPCTRAVALLDSAERILRRLERSGSVPAGVAASWLAEREKLPACPCAAAPPMRPERPVGGHFAPRILALLQERPRTAEELAAALGTYSGAVHGALSTLNRRGFVKRGNGVWTAAERDGERP